MAVRQAYAVRNSGKLTSAVFMVSYSTVYSNRSGRKQHGAVNFEITKVQYLLPAYCMGDTYFERLFTWYTQMHLVKWPGEVVRVELL